MGKKRKKEDESDSQEDAKKKKKEKKAKKKKDKKGKKDKKKKKKEAKKGKKKKSSSSSASSSSDSESENGGGEVGAPAAMLNLPPPEEGIQRFAFGTDEAGPLGLRFSGGFPPIILAVKPDSFAGSKGVPVNFEVHAINGFELVKKNRENIMSCLGSRPVTLDVRPIGWLPKDKAMALKKKEAEEEAERNRMIAIESQRRDKVAQEQKEEAERHAREEAERKERQKIEKEALKKRAREQLAKQREKEQEFEKALATDSKALRHAAKEVMEAEYGVNLLGEKRLPLRLFTRRKEVAWLWAGEAQELIGGGVPDGAGTDWS